MGGSDRVYLWPAQWIMNVILDAIELQKGEVISSGDGIVQYETEMYGVKHEFTAVLTDLPRNRCRVSISASGGSSNLAAGQFAILENLIISAD